MPRQHSMLTQELTDRELFESAIQVLPNLRAVAASHECVGPNWKAKTRRPNAHMYEFDAFASGLGGARPRSLSSASASALRFWPWTRGSSTRPRASVVHFDRASPTTASAPTSSAWPSVNAGVPFASVTFCDLHCHWTEALDLLFNNDSVQFSASARAIWGKKLRRCDQLRTAAVKREPRVLSPSDWSRRDVDRHRVTDTVPPSRIAVNTYELARKHDLHVAGKHTQLCFATYTQQSPSKNEAVVVMKTLRKDVHDRLVDGSDHSALRGAIDHIAVGYHLTGHYNDHTGHHTRLVMCAYVSSFSGHEVSEVMHWRVGLRDNGDRANADAKHVVTLLARAACDFETVLQRRRFGREPFQFQYVALASRTVNSTADATSCAACERDFGLLRRFHRCELCGHHVCRRCSRKYEIEPRAGGVRKSRVCVTCAGRVESTVFNKPPDVLSGKKSSVSTWYETVEDGDDDCDDRYQAQSQGSLGLPTDVLQSPKPCHELAEALFSPHPLYRARALEVVKGALRQVTQETAGENDNRPLDPSVIDKYLEARQRLTRMSSREFLNDNADATVGSRGLPLFYQQPLSGSAHRALRSTTAMSRRQYAPWSSLGPVTTRAVATFDASDSNSTVAVETDGLDAICEVAARRIACPMAFVSVLGRDEQHIVGAYQVPECLYRLPRNQSIRSCRLLSDDVPVVVRNPLHDPRLRHMPILRDAGVRFFASFPVADRNGAVVAAICVFDTLSHDELSQDEYLSMAALAKLTADVLDDQQPSPVQFPSRNEF